VSAVDHLAAEAMAFDKSQQLAVLDLVGVKVFPYASTKPVVVSPVVRGDNGTALAFRPGTQANGRLGRRYRPHVGPPRDRLGCRASAGAAPAGRCGALPISARAPR
jgi:hypothetical protein